MFSEPIHSPLQKIELEVFRKQGIEVWMKRDDLIHPEISGNKWRKLKYNLLKAIKQEKNLIITLGGAYSNHILATASLGSEFGIKTKGVIRGDELTGNNPTLKKAKELGMELEFISRAYYNDRNEDWFKKELLERHTHAFYIPEGGANFLGVQGCTEIIKEIDIDFDCIFTAAGTGTTAAGLCLGIKSNQKIFAVSALKGDFLKQEIHRLLFECVLEKDFVFDLMQMLELLTDYHFGGYARVNDQLINFMRSFYSESGIKLDPIYTAKMMWALVDLIEREKLEAGTRVIALHTGGLQGIAGIENRIGESIYA